MKEPSPGRVFVAVCLCSAVLVAVLRFLNVAELGFDLTLQIQAAQNLLAGQGLSIYRHTAPELARPAQLVTLTHFPAGVSLFTAALVSLGASVGTVIKVLGAAATVLGWWGWARLTKAFFGAHPPRSRVWQWAGFLIAALAPLRHTPPWSGTDIVLWASVPWVLIWVVRASDEMSPGGSRLDWAAGAVCGLCLLMRYASLFLVVYVACVMFWQSRMRLVLLTRRWALFGLGFLPAFLVQFYVNYVLSNAPARPGGLGSGDGSLGFVLHRAREGFPLLGAANYPWAFWLPGQLVDFFTQTDGALPWRAGIVVAVFIAIVSWVVTYDRGVGGASGDFRLVASGLFVALPLVLWVSMTLSSYAYLADQRYYWPLVPLMVLLGYAQGSRTTNRRSRLLAVTYLAGFVTVGLIGIAMLIAPGERGAMQRGRLIGTSSFDHWPSMRLTHDFYPARQFVRELLAEQPDTLVLTSKTQWFFADPTVDRSRVLTLTCDRPAGGRLTGPARVVVLTFDKPGPPEALWAWAGDYRSERATCFEGLPGLRVLRRFPAEGVKVLESRVPPGKEVVVAPTTGRL